MKKGFILFVAVATCIAAWADTNLQPVSVYARSNGGFVMVDTNGEIIGFSDHGTPNQVSEDLQDIFHDFGMDVQPASKVAPKHIEAMLSAELTDSVGPLLNDIAFGQGAPYNGMAPTGQGGQRCVAGCVAIAMAQIMTYYQYPKEACKGSVSYKTTTISKTIEVNFEGETFDWDNILPTYKNGYTPEQADAVAKLVYYCGAAAHMDYGVGASGTNSDFVVSALAANFGYDENLRRLSKGGDGYTEAEWHELMQSELKQKYPIYMSSQQESGSGHAYVCDGYKIVKGMEKYPYYHMNWGWNGSLDGWFLLNSLKPGADNPEGFLDLSFTQSIIYKIRPKGYTPVENVTTDNANNDDVIYDILGRRVSEMKAGNIYIKNGKKFIAR